MAETASRTTAALATYLVSRTFPDGASSLDAADELVDMLSEERILGRLALAERMVAASRVMHDWATLEKSSDYLAARDDLDAALAEWAAVGTPAAGEG